ncbi:MAG: hypothetical protein DRG78_03840 [Epsilonproteobacteria bacterium]|nr:MAG: hypothetical protein DRG78_03840 [Campylobacterota bacterium]
MSHNPKVCGFPFAFQEFKGLTAISVLTASKLINEFNVYFRTYNVNIAMNDVNRSVYKMDNLKDFDSQYETIKTIHFEDYFKGAVEVYLFTDYKTSREVLLNKIKESHIKIRQNNLKTKISSKKQSVNLTNLHKDSKVDKEIVKEYLKSLDKFHTASLFSDLD